MAVLRLFIKQRPHPGVIPQSGLTLEQGQGIVGDDSACSSSPRQILLVDQSSLERLGLQPGDLQENVLLNIPMLDWSSGQVWQLGDSALVRLTIPCEPCATLERLRPGLVRQIRGQRGWLGRVIRGGSVQVGDAIARTDYQCPAIPETSKARFQALIARIPPGRALRTSDVIRALGFATAYYRAIPALLKSAPRDLPVHRIIAADGRLLTKHLPQQAQRLQSEGIDLSSGSVAAGMFWDSEEFYTGDESLHSR